jgi:hypothetical protein
VLRAVSVIPVGKGVSMVVKFGLQRVAVRATLFSAVRGGLCAPISGAQAVRRAGQMVLMKLDDILLKSHGARLLDLALDSRTGISLSKLADVLRQLGAKVNSIHGVSSIDDVARVMQGSDVGIIHIKWFNTIKSKESQHAIHVFIDHLGKLRISDRTGHVVSSLQELGRLVPAYGGIENAVVHEGVPALLVRGLKVLEIIDRVGFAEFFLALTPQIIVNADQADPEIVVQSVEAKIMRDETKTVPAKLPPAPVTAKTVKKLKPKVPPVEYLTGVKFRLNHLGYAAGPPIHLYDEKCKRAIRAFQRDYRLLVDAIPGPQTQGKLRQVCGY